MQDTDFLARRQKWVEEQNRITAGLASIVASLREYAPKLSESERVDLLGVFNDILATSPPPSREDRPQAPDSSSQLPKATPAILHLLHEHPQGLLMSEIESLLEGRFQTDSPSWRFMLQSAATKLRRRHTIVLDDDGRYRVAPAGYTPPPGPSSRMRGKAQRPPTFKLIARYLHKTNEPATLNEIVERVGLRNTRVRSALHLHAGTYFLRSDREGTHVWTLNPDMIAEMLKEEILTPADQAETKQPSGTKRDKTKLSGTE